MAHVADVVQRIGRRRELKTLVEKRFAGWHDLLLNSLLALAAELGLSRVHVPTSRSRCATRTRRTVQPELFERIYDRAVSRLYRTERMGTGGRSTSPRTRTGSSDRSAVRRR